MKVLFKLVTILSLVLSTVVYADELREKVSLNDEWKLSIVNSIDEEKPPVLEGANWQQVEVPYYGVWDYTWWEKKFDIPESMENKRIKVRFESVAFKAIVYVNGKRVGEHFGAWMPFEFDITDIAKFDTQNVLLVGVINQKIATKEKRLTADLMMGDSNGIWGDVNLIAYPEVYIEDVWVIPSFRNKSLSLEVTIRNESDENFEGVLLPNILDDGKAIKSFPKEPVSVRVGTKSVLRVSYPWVAPNFWSPENPYLYWLKAHIIRQDKIVDETQVRFGFREFWIEGDHFMFNGMRLNLRGDSSEPQATWPWPDPGIAKLVINGGWSGRPSIRDKQGTQNWYKERFLFRKSLGLRYSRTHWIPDTPDFLDAADEVGYLIQPEFYWAWGHDCKEPSPVMGHLGKYAFPQYEEWIKRDRNHPSIIVWGAENEYLLHNVYLHPGEVGNACTLLNKVNDFIHKLDPTRPVIFEGDGELLGGLHSDDGSKGKTDTTSWHYDRDVPRGYTKAPNIYYWLLDPNDPPTWSRKKPLWDGEALATSMMMQLEPLTIFRGEEIYKDVSTTPLPSLMNKNDIPVARAFCESVKMCMEAYRYMGVNWGNFTYWHWGDSGHGPDQADEIRNVIKDSAKACQPLAVFVKEYDHNFYSGEKVTRELPVYNDMLHDAELLLNWETSMDGTIIESDKISLMLKAGESKRVPVTINIPEVNERKEIKFRLRIEEPGTDNRFEDEKVYTAFPLIESKLNSNARISLFDPQGKTKHILKALGLNYTTISNLQDISKEKSDVLITGKGSLPLIYTIKGLEPREQDRDIIEGFKKVEEFIQKGGRVVVFEHQKFSPSFLSLDLKTKDSASATMTFNIASHHPVMKDIQGEDLKFWRGDNVVSESPIIKPGHSNIKILIESGTGQGLIVSPLFEIKKGKGAVIFSQLELSEKFGKEPVADQIAYNILNYVINYQEKVLGRLGIVSDNSSDTVSFLNKITVDSGNLNGGLFNVDLNQYACIIVDGSTKENIDYLNTDINAIKTYLNNGGTLIFHNLKPGAEDVIKILTGTELIPQQITQNYYAWKKESHPILDGISNFELYYGKAEDYQILRGREIIENAYQIKQGEGTNLLEPGVLILINSGKGRVIIDQILWEGSDDKFINKRIKYISTLLTNLGISLESGRKSVDKSEKILYKENEIFFVDLKPYCNMGFKDDVAGDGKGGWSDEGNNDLKYFPADIQVFRGVPFNVIDPENNSGKSCIEPFFVKERSVKGIKVNKKFKAIYFLYGGTFTLGNRGDEMAYYEINYRDDSKIKVPIRYGIEIDDWYLPVPESDTVKKAWEGDNGFHSPISITSYRWNNPNSEKEIKDIDLILPPLSSSRYGLIAITGILESTSSMGVIQLIPTGIVKNGKGISLEGGVISYSRESNDPNIGEPQVEFKIEGSLDISSFNTLSFNGEFEDAGWVNLSFSTEDEKRIVTENNQIKVSQGKKEYSVNLSSLKWKLFGTNLPAKLEGRIRGFWLLTSHGIGSTVMLEKVTIH